MALLGCGPVLYRIVSDNLLGYEICTNPSFAWRALVRSEGGALTLLLLTPLCHFSWETRPGPEAQTLSHWEQGNDMMVDCVYWWVKNCGMDRGLRAAPTVLAGIECSRCRGLGSSIVNQENKCVVEYRGSKNNCWWLDAKWFVRCRSNDQEKALPNKITNFDRWETVSGSASEGRDARDADSTASLAGI